MKENKQNTKESNSTAITLLSVLGFITVFALLKKTFVRDNSLISEEGRELLTEKSKEEIDQVIAKARKNKKSTADIKLSSGKTIKIAL